MKKKGSALVFSVLMLAFFLAISLNIFFQARKKAERAGVKVQGEVTSNNIDIASSLGYQELQLAEKFVREGFPYTDSHPYSINSYTLANGSHFYIDISTGFYTSRYSGIQLNNFIDYFSSNWDHGGSSNQKLIMGEEISGGEVVSRMWQSAGVDSSATPLWKLKIDNPSDTSLSIGGYSLKTAPALSDTTMSEPVKTTSAVYEKLILLDEFTLTVNGEDIDVPQSVFRVEVEEQFDYTKSGSVITFSNRSIESFVIEALD